MAERKNVRGATRPSLRNAGLLGLANRMLLRRIRIPNHETEFPTLYQTRLINDERGPYAQHRK